MTNTHSRPGRTRGSSLLELVMSSVLLASLMAISGLLAQGAQGHHRQAVLTGAADGRLQEIGGLVQHELGFAAPGTLRVGPVDDAPLKAREQYPLASPGSIPAALELTGGYVLLDGGEETFVDYREIAYQHAWAIQEGEALLGQRHSIWWEATEAVDGIDNDGDDLVDEGKLMRSRLLSPGVKDDVVILADNVLNFRIYKENAASDGRSMPTNRIVIQADIATQARIGAALVKRSLETVIYVRGAN